MKKILLLYITDGSGHHKAAKALEKAIKRLEPDASINVINCFNYTNPILEKVINRTYMSVIKNTPEVWDYLYDNPKVVKNTQTLRSLIHRFNSGKLKNLMDDFAPDAVVCTQAFPCGMVADYKNTYDVNIPLYGVLTDYYPHSYWVYDSVDGYIVPSESAMEQLVINGIPRERIHIFGIPVDAAFAQTTHPEGLTERLGLKKGVATVLIMGGSQGLGPIKEMVWHLNMIGLAIQIVVLAGTNAKLLKWLRKKSKFYKVKTVILEYTDSVAQLMDISDIIVTKPGGLTTAEALAKRLPMMIIDPIPGQEMKNTHFLLKEGVAVMARDKFEAGILLKELVNNRSKLGLMKNAASGNSKPDSAARAAELILGSIR
ncbi:MAG: hypothetical protein AUJ75_02535 [Candidatus Omnitrophica bacterium CG1_02_49_10]|nr:MAG: hypothetical protein AUJ75_02535 [Candidatus Omnitrophica bacterium CG1_02_49_10]